MIIVGAVRKLVVIRDPGSGIRKILEILVRPPLIRSSCRVFRFPDQ